MLPSPGGFPSRPLKVCHVSLSLNTGGLERVLSLLASHQSSRHVHLQFLALQSEGRFADSLREQGFDVQLCPAKTGMATWRWLKAFFQQHRFEVVHTHNTYPAIHATLPARWAKVPIVVNTRHGQRIGHGWKSRWLFRFAARFLDRIVTVSHDAARLTVTQDHVPSRLVSTIWNGIDLNAFAFTGGNRTPTAISIGRLVPEKDLQTMIHGVVQAKPLVPELRLLIVGGGPLEGTLRNMVESLNATGYIHFLGEQSNVPALLSQSGFLISTSLSEGISLTILEAMAVGLPVIATKVGGNPEIMEESEWLIEPQSPSQLARAIVQLTARSSEWDEWALRGRRRMETHFSAPRMSQHYLELYTELARQKRLKHFA